MLFLCLFTKAKTSDQWKDKCNISPSPVCRGGFGK